MSKREQSSNAKERLLHKGCSVDDLKEKIRSQFQNRLIDARRSSMEMLRKLIREDGMARSVKEMDPDYDPEDIHPDQVYEMIRETQESILLEMLNNEAKDYEVFQQQQTDSIVENLLSCKICGNVCSNDICTLCSKHFND